MTPDVVVEAKLKRLRRNIFRFIRIVMIMLVLIVAIMFSGLLVLRYNPVSLPTPTGKYGVGRVEFDFTDASRSDSLAANTGVKRELAVWIWYPASPSSQRQSAPYLPDQWADALNKAQGFNIFGLHSYAAIRTHSVQQVPLAPTNTMFPLLIFEPGLGLSAPDYTVYEENLASHGYVVVGITPTFSADVTAFISGEVVIQDAKGLISGGNADAERLLAVWSQDVQFVMTQVVNLGNDPTSIFYGRLDTADIGLLGHSFGGATALDVCLRDIHCKAEADVDGMPYGSVLSQPETRPLLFITHDYLQNCGISCSAINQVYRNAKNAAYEVSVTGTYHLNFSDAALQYDLPIDTTGDFGPIDKNRALEISNAYLVAFFDTYLKNAPDPLLSASSTMYPEARFSSHP